MKIERLLIESFQQIGNCGQKCPSELTKRISRWVLNDEKRIGWKMQNLYTLFQRLNCISSIVVHNWSAYYALSGAPLYRGIKSNGAVEWIDLFSGYRN